MTMKVKDTMDEPHGQSTDELHFKSDMWQMKVVVGGGGGSDETGMLHYHTLTSGPMFCVTG